MAPLDAITDKASNELTKEAHDAIYSAVQLSTGVAQSSETELNAQEVEDRISRLKSLMAEGGLDTGRMRNAIKELKEAESKLRDKVHDHTVISSDVEPSQV